MGIPDSYKELAVMLSELGGTVGELRGENNALKDRIAALEKQNSLWIESLSNGPYASLADILLMCAEVAGADAGATADPEPRPKSRWQQRIEEIQAEQHAAAQKRT